MDQSTSTSDSDMSQRRAARSELFTLVHRMSCACATHSRHIDAPMSLDVFCRVEDQNQSLIEAAEILGLGPRDCAYLLAGFRRDLAAELVSLLLSAKLPDPVVECQSHDIENWNEGR
ncbi:hypothetical protein G5B38_18925 (plasmid) [Pseudohalocynthiibacter aestuariivivens]|jgi:hypothetical protein|nr:hypothetical protein [Pseudohalocynthiibacter aestuariivivens]QIE47716.1 hypothetical protein G5B38_18925 [Pseudohalocynthiibacter aestuariivivens]